MDGLTLDVTTETPLAQPSHAPLEQTAWGTLIPWLVTAASLLVLVSLAWFLIENIFWFRGQIFPPQVTRDDWFTLYAFHVYLAILTRSVGLFSGFALIFIGTAVSFYSLHRETIVESTASGVGGKLATASPGIVAMILGAAVIMFTIYSKNQFENIPEQLIQTVPAALPLRQPPVPPPQ